MRTLVIGIPLPHVSFDNYSFVAAPSLGDYRRVVVDIEGVSQVVEETAHGVGQRETFSGLRVVNGPSSTESFSLAELLAMRRRETEWCLDRGGTVVCFAHPDVALRGIQGADEWRRYDWLPAPEGFSYTDHLPATFGRPGVIPVDDSHPFSAFFRALAPRLAHRVQISEEFPGAASAMTVLARSPGGMAVGAELKVSRGAVILLPALLQEKDRTAAAQALLECFEEWERTYPPRDYDAIDSQGGTVNATGEDVEAAEKVGRD